MLKFVFLPFVLQSGSGSFIPASDVRSFGIWQGAVRNLQALNAGEKNGAQNLLTASDLK